ncbi:MAG: TonB-dependent receptor [Oceanococcus sp.]|nr:MAG: TonB-dependent receptor [Oceanococcus sp.]
MHKRPPGGGVGCQDWYWGWAFPRPQPSPAMTIWMRCSARPTTSRAPPPARHRHRSAKQPPSPWRKKPTPSARPAQRGRVLEEIIVTAQKREQSLTDVPISVSALSGEKLRDAGIENLSDLSEYAPNFKLVEGGLVPLIYMRGAGSGSNQGFEMSVGLYNDGIHLGRPHLTLAAFLDVERIEVLKGPQSILFGKNAIAGAMNVTSGQPRDSFDASLSASWFEPFEDRELSGFATGPLSDTLNGRVALRWRDEGGYVYNRGQQRDDPQLEELAGRGTLQWTPSDEAQFTLKFEHSGRDSTGRTYQIVDNGILTESENNQAGLDDMRETNEDEFMELVNDSITLNGRIDIGEHTLELVSGFTTYDQIDAFDADSSGVDTIFLIGQEDYSQFSQEIRWVSPPGEHFDFIAGAFYQQAEQEFNEFGDLKVRTGTLEFAALPGELIDIVAQAGPANTVVVISADLARLFTVDSRSSSLFAQGTWHFAQDWRLTAGARYVHETKDGYRNLEAYQPGTEQDVDPVTAAALAQLKIEAHTLSGKRESNTLLPSINLQHDLNDAVMLYGYWSRGAKSGGYDARNNNAQDGPTGGGENFEYQDEIADAAELGSKIRFASGTAELNLALYRVEYEDMQVSVFDGVAGFTVTNAGSALVQGLEVDGRWLLGDHLMLSGALAYLDFEWQSYVDGPCYFGAPDASDEGTCDLSGRENQQTPKWSGSLSAAYTDQLKNGLHWGLTLDANFRTDHYISGDLDPRGLQRGFTKYNLRLSLEAADRRWGIALMGKNLTDELTTGIGAPAPLDTGSYMATSERRRTYGLELRYRFGD